MRDGRGRTIHTPVNRSVTRTNRRLFRQVHGTQMHSPRNLDGVIDVQHVQGADIASAGIRSSNTSAKKIRQISDVKPALPRQSRSAVLTRNIHTSNPVRSRVRRKVRIRIPVLIAMAVMSLSAFGTVFAYTVWHNNQELEHLVLAKNTDEVDEPNEISEKVIAPEIIAGYEVEADLPRTVTIPRLQVQARIKRMVSKSDGELTAPKNIHDAGWYDGSVKPGETGTSLLIGHVYGTTKPGIFNRVNNLTVGDVIEIERGDGEKITYKVVSMESMDQEEVDLAKALMSSEASKPALNLLTHSGRYDVRTNKYEQRTLVHAVMQ